MKPTDKMAATGVAGAAVLILVWLAGLAGLEVPAEVAGAAVLIIAWCVGWLTRERRPAAPAPDAGRHAAGAP